MESQGIGPVNCKKPLKIEAYNYWFEDFFLTCGEF